MGFESGLDINKIINSLSQLNKIEYSDSDGLFSILAEKYDKNKNSIFDADEIQQIKNDLSIFAVSEDDNANNLSEKESVNFITSITTAKNIIDKSSKDILDYVSNLFNNLTVSGREQDLEAFINENGWQDRFSTLLLDPNHKLSDLNAEQYARLKNLMSFQKDDKFLENFQIWELALLDINEEAFERAKQLAYIKGRDCQLKTDEISVLVNCEEEQYKRVLELLTYSHKGEQLEVRDISTLSEFNEEQFEKLLNLFRDDYTEFKIPNSYNDGTHIEDITDLKELGWDKINRLKYLLDLEEKRGDRFAAKELGFLLSLSENRFEKAKKFLYIEDNKQPQFSAVDAVDLIDFTEKRLQRAKDLGLLSSGIPIARVDFLLRNLTNDEINWVSEYVLPNIRDIEDKALLSLVKNRNKEIEELILNNPNRATFSFNDSTTIMEIDNNTYYFDKDGIFETSIEENVEVENYKDCKRYVITNKRLNIRQEIIKGTIENGYENIVIEEKITHFDDNGNITKIVNIKRAENGTLNVSETNNSGETTPVPWESFELNGSRIIKRHFTTPDGIKTDIYNKESEDLKIMEYKITDSSGNAIMQLNTAFLKIDDNTYISSINATGKEEDTQVYDIKYNDDYTIIIYDRKNNEETTIDLKQFFNNDASAEKLLPVIKQLPGHVLLEFAEKGFELQYNEELKFNACFHRIESMLEIGNYTTTVGNNTGNTENTEIEEMFGTLTHELGHYLDLYYGDGEFSGNQEILNIFNEEFEEFKNNTTNAQQENISYLTETITNYWGRPANNPGAEMVAETHAIMNSANHAQTNFRKYYFAKYFPRTLAAIMKVLLNEEGVKTN